jgi:hypothetical protein
VRRILITLVRSYHYSGSSNSIGSSARLISPSIEGGKSQGRGDGNTFHTTCVFGNFNQFDSQAMEKMCDSPRHSSKSRSVRFSPSFCACWPRLKIPHILVGAEIMTPTAFNPYDMCAVYSIASTNSVHRRWRKCMAFNATLVQTFHTACCVLLFPNSVHKRWRKCTAFNAYRINFKSPQSRPG